MICLCESEVILTQLHLYTRRRYPGIGFDERSLRGVLEEAGITSMRALFQLDAGARAELADRVLARLPAALRPTEQRVA
jgi:hypothetical protein